MNQLSGKIIASVAEIFSSMIMLETKPGKPQQGEINPLQATVTGLVGLAGTHKGMLAVHIPEELAKTVTGNFLGMPIEQIDDDVQDAIGELANMLGGSLKSMLSENGKDIKLSMPSTIYGKEYRFQSLTTGESTVIPFRTEGAQFLVELKIQKEE